MSFSVRALHTADQGAARRLGREAFGMPDAARPDPEPPADRPWPRPGTHALGTFHGAQLAAKAVALDLGTWAAGHELRTCGVAGVTVAAEYRGQGLTHPLLVELLRAAADRGDVLATLFATAPGIYRRLGFELVSTVDEVVVPATAAAAVRPGGPVQLRRAEPADVPALRACYTAWARQRYGPLTRTGALADSDEALLEGSDAVTLTTDADGEVLGYACWDRGGMVARTLTITELVGLTSDAYRALWRMAGALAMKVDQVVLHAPAGDVARHFLPSKHWQVASQEPYLLRVLDLPAALAARGGCGSGQVSFTVAGDPLGLVEGSYQVVVDGGALRCEQIAPREAGPVLTVNGLSLLFAGAARCADLRVLGHLSGGEAASDRALEDLLSSPPWQLRDTF